MPEDRGGDTTQHLLAERRARFAQREARCRRASLSLSRARLTVATAGVACLVTAVVQASTDPVPWIWGMFGAAGVFVVLVLVHERVIRQQESWKTYVELQEEGLARIDRWWDRLPVPEIDAPVARGEMARDLQLFGRASLAQLLGAAQSPPGRLTLSRWLVDPAPLEEAQRRQGLVAALAPALDFRQELAFEGRRLAALTPDVEPFLRWAEGAGWLASRRHWLWIARLLPLVAWSAAGLAVIDMAPVALPVALFGLSFLVANRLARPLKKAHDRVSLGDREILSYGSCLATLWSPHAEAIDAPVLERLRGGLSAAGRPAPEHLKALQRRLELADTRHSGSLRFLLDTLFLWDLHTLWLLERWQRHVGKKVRGWLERLGELEALSALAGLAFEEPEWSFPAFDPDADRLQAERLAHPLLPARTRIANDLTVGPPGAILFVTGSNMSGKSTLLRALGLNVVLAWAGGPVCARRFTLPPVELATSILVEDSLEHGVSFFMAEVLRVREVIHAAEHAARRGRRLVFLLDEVLRGTNSADRRIAVREVLQRLLELGAIGAVTTHDLALAAEPELRDVLIPVHFRETLHPDATDGELPMSFDYLLRPGIAPTTNALKLLEMFGLPEGGT